MDRPAGRACVRRGLLAVAALAAALAVAPAAGAHATLTTTEPANDAVLEQAPRQIVLHFDEPVESSFGSVRVYDSQARRVDRGDEERPDERTIAAPLDDRLARGTYTVTWRATSADAHPVSGAFVFHVQAPGREPVRDRRSGARRRDAAERERALHVRALPRLRRLFLVVGGAVALATILQGPQPLLRRVLAVAGVALAIVALLGIVLQGAAAGGFGLGEAASWESVRAVLETRFGRVWLAQGLLGLLVAALALSRVPAPALLLPAALLVTDAVALGPCPSQRRALARLRRRPRRRRRRLDRWARLPRRRARSGRRGGAGRSRRLRCRASRVSRSGRSPRCSWRESSTATSSSARGVASGTRRTGCSCWRRSRSSCRCSRSAPTTTAVPCRGCRRTPPPRWSGGASSGWRWPSSRSWWRSSG